MVPVFWAGIRLARDRSLGLSLGLGIMLVYYVVVFLHTENFFASLIPDAVDDSYHYESPLVNVIASGLFFVLMLGCFLFMPAKTLRTTLLVFCAVIAIFAAGQFVSEFFTVESPETPTDEG